MLPPADSPRRRLYRVLALCAALLLAGGAYAVVCRLTGFGIPCPFYRLTGRLCPGCGVSRMCISLLRGDFAAAWQYNAAILCLLPFGLAVAADIAVRYVRDGTKQPRPWASAMLWIMAAVLLGFGIWRNLRLS